MRKAIDIATRSIQKHEPLRLRARGNIIGYGRNLEGRGISEGEALSMLRRDVLECVRDLESFSYWANMTPTQRAALIGLRFCLGPVGYRSLEDMNVALADGAIEDAAAQIRSSDFAQQDAERAKDLVAMLLG